MGQTGGLDTGRACLSQGSLKGEGLGANFLGLKTGWTEDSSLYNCPRERVTRGKSCTLGPCSSQHSLVERDTLEVCTEPTGTGGDDDAFEVAASYFLCIRLILVLGSWTSLCYSLPSSWSQSPGGFSRYHVISLYFPELSRRTSDSMRSFLPVVLDSLFPSI